MEMMQQRIRQIAGGDQAKLARLKEILSWFDNEWERRDGGFGMEMMERRGGGFAMEKRDRSQRQRFRIGGEGRRAVTGSKSKSIYSSIKKGTPH